MSKLLIGGDFSGIQPYLYQVISKNASKALKGRSFYMKMLSDAVTRLILDRLGLPQSNCIYSSGGCFYIEAPDTEEVKTQLELLRTEIERKMFSAHGGVLYVAIDWVRIDEDNDDHLTEYWHQLFVKRDKLKQHRLSSIIEAEPGSFFEPAQPELDSSSGNDQEIDIGKKLKDAKHMLVSSTRLSTLSGGALEVNPAGLGIFFYLLDGKDYSKAKSLLGQAGIDDIDFGETPVNTKKTFEELCDNDKAGNKKDSFTRMGVLRMDVDNLGTIFQNAANKPHPSLNDYGELSRQLDYFFTKRLSAIYNSLDPDHSFIVYSGGDDVFAVGRWDVIIKLAERIHKEFCEYMGNDPMYSISGGISIVEPKFPIMRAALYSGEEEDNAKGHCQKNSISFFSTPLRWNDEFVCVKALKDEMVRLLTLGANPLDKSFLSKLMNHCANAKIKNHKITVMKTFWMLTYDLGRMKGRVSDSDAKNLIENCIKEVCCKTTATLNGHPLQTEYHPLELWTFAARWAELEYRKDRSNN